MSEEASFIGTRVILKLAFKLGSHLHPFPSSLHLRTPARITRFS